MRTYSCLVHYGNIFYSLILHKEKKFQITDKIKDRFSNITDNG